MITKKKASPMTRTGNMVMIPVIALEFREGGNTLWIHGQGGTVLRLKTLDGVITSKRCQSSPISHGDAIIQGNLEICVADESEGTAAFEGHTLCPRGCCEDTPTARDFGNGGRWEGPK